MALKRDIEEEESMSRAVDEMKSLISKAFPEVTFEVGPGYDPDGVYLDAILDTADFEDFSAAVLKLVNPRLLELWGKDIALFVIPELTPERNAERNRLIRAEAWPN